jgi:hypothetical protein
MLIFLVGLVVSCVAPVVVIGVARIVWAYLKLAFWLAMLPFRFVRFTILAAWHVGAT